ncbi:MAG: preprotein translocase subunit SecD, partial [Candidatus Diapherotrites archaeon]|nr:preprotein translocase subunit SecD [Candidatus Diapherotrites archaeon]
MNPLLKNWRVRLLIIALVLAAGIIVFKGIDLGVDFSGGTILIFRFDRPLTPDEMQQAVQIISQRVNWTGLASVDVRGWGDQYVFVELSTSDPQEIEYMKESVLRQGKMEVLVDGNVVLKGDEIATVKPATYTPLSTGVRWQIPFVVSAEGLERFCAGVEGKPGVYSFTYIDRPAGS